MPNKIEKLLLMELQHLNALRHVVSLPLYCLIFITKDIYRLVLKVSAFRAPQILYF